MRPLLLALAIFATISSALPADEPDAPFDALQDLHSADLSRALDEAALRLNSSSDPGGRTTPAAMTDYDRSLALGRALADLTAAGRARDAAALERAGQALAALGPTGEAVPLQQQQRRERFLQAAKAGRWPMVEAALAALRLERLRAHGQRYGADQATLAGAGLWLRLLELSASVRCHGGSGPVQGPLLRPVPTQKLRERLAALGPETKKQARVQSLTAQVESLAARAVPAEGTVAAAEACRIKTIAAVVP
ncbi:MAG: hypothetical protein JSR82_06180 [Verrucomicrobia bacterium]|nr:hypothetical protein [Verrucomicrobiota bacterium]